MRRRMMEFRSDSLKNDRMITRNIIHKEGAVIQVSAFELQSGAGEYHVMVHPTPGRCFEEQMTALVSAMESLLTEEFHCAKPLFIRYFMRGISLCEASLYTIFYERCG